MTPKNRASVLGLSPWVLLAMAALDGACGSNPRQPAAAVAVEEALTAPACKTNNVRIVDLHADFRDLWAGRETAATGKQADPDASVSIDFSTTIDPTKVIAQYVPVAAGGSCGATVSSTLTASVLAAGVWGSLTSDATLPAAPSPYNVLVREDIQGVVSVGGALAAGRDVALTSMSVNGTVRQPVGLVAGGKVVVSSGSVAGDVTFGVASTIPGTVSVGGKARQQAFSVAAAFSSLESLSTLLAAAAATGTSKLSNGTLQLTGALAGLNVFQIDAATLAQASAIQISAPANAGALIVVAGTSVDLVNKGLSLQGVTASSVLWNIPSARLARVSGISLQGSLLAPQAQLTFDSGNINGTVVARSFTSSGSGSLQSAPLKTATLFGAATPVSVLIKAAQPLVRGCTYRLTLPSTTVLTAGGACLASPLTVTFQVAGNPAPPASRELVNVQPDAANHTLRRFTARTGINTPTDDALARYQSRIGLPLADLVPAATGRPSATRRSQIVTAYRQFAQGYPVVGYGFFVASENGLFRGASGKVAPGLPAFAPPTVTSSAALQAALTFLKITRPPWVATPTQFQAPAGTLVVVSKQPFPMASDFALAWNFSFGGKTGISNPSSVQVDAASGAVLAANPGLESVSTFDPTTATAPTPVSSQVETIFNGMQTFTATQYHTANGAIVETLATGNVTQPGVLATVTGVALGPKGDILPTPSPQYVFDPTGEPWTSTELVEQRMATAQWALELSSAFLKTLGLNVGGNPWTTIDGVGHQRVLLNVVDPGVASKEIAPGYFLPNASNADVAQIVLNSVAPRTPVEPDVVSHEFAHALVADLRRDTSIGAIAGIREAGATKEGLSDLFAIAFNHKMLPAGGPPWECFLDQAIPSPNSFECLENIANPHAGVLNAVNKGQPDLYRDGTSYQDYVSQPAASCDSSNDRCGVHVDSTIVSHWGYLLAAGTAAATKVPCGVEIVPLDPDLDTSFKMALNIALLAAGTRLAQTDPNQETETTFADFRDATLQIAEELAAESSNPSTGASVYPADVALKVALAWAAVGLPAANTSSSVAAPANLSGAYPWTTFVWPQSGEGQSGTSWDFQISNSSFFEAVLAFSTDSITDTVVGSNPTMSQLPLALPFDSQLPFYWRVRPHSADPWLNCYPVHSFEYTTHPDPVTNMKVVSELDAGGLVSPGPFTMSWDAVHGTAPPRYAVSVATRDPKCQPGADVTQVPDGLSVSADGKTETDAVKFTTQPRTHYFVDVRPVGPMDFTKQPSLGGCFSLELDTGDLKPPTIVNPNEVYIYDDPWQAQLEWGVSGGPTKSRITFYDRDEKENCATSPLMQLPAREVTVACSDSCQILSILPKQTGLPNPTGYCWDVVDVAANGATSPPSTTKGMIRFETAVSKKPSPGVAVGETPAPLTGDSFGNPVTFQWATAAQPGFPAAPEYGLKVGRWPWPLVLSTPEPANCHGNSCFSGAESEQTFTSIRGGQLTVPGDQAGMGRYCWSVWPTVEDPANPGDPWIRQPLVSIFPQYCYTSGPALPQFEPMGATGGAGTLAPLLVRSGQQALIRIKDDYVPDGQIRATFTSNGVVELSRDGFCPLDPTALQYADAYNCDVPLTFTPSAESDFELEVQTFNSDKHPAVMDDSTMVHDVVQPILVCGGAGNGRLTTVCCDDEPKCGSGYVCVRGTPFCKPNGTLTEQALCTRPFCSACGAEANYCCATDPKCKDPSLDCTVPVNADDPGSCVHCGKLGSDCPCQNTPCPSGSDCISGTCQACGRANGQCCPGNKCDSPNQCQAGTCVPGAPTCNQTLPAPSLPLAPNTQALIDAGCFGIADVDAKAACILSAGSAVGDLCSSFIPAISPGLAWPAVAGAAQYQITMIGDGTIPLPPVDADHITTNGRVDTAISLGLPPVPGTLETCGFNGYYVLVSAIDNCGKVGNSAVTGIGVFPQ